MSTTLTPAWAAPRNGVIGDASAIAAPGAVNQFLGTHADTLIYQGASILTPDGRGATPWTLSLSSGDVDQPFTMSGTTVGRVQVPILPVGDGADLLVSLCGDNAGSPGSVITQTRIPASWIYQSAAIAGVPGPQGGSPTTSFTGNPLAATQFNGLHMGRDTSVKWPYPTSGSGGPSTGACSTCAGNFIIQMGGAAGATYYDNVYSISFDAAGNLAQAVPQPSLPVPTDGTSSAVVATDASGNATLVFMGGQTGDGVYADAVYAAGFDATTGNVSAWSVQTSLPSANNLFGAAAYNQFVYVIGGSNPGRADVYVNTVSNGQLGNWVSTTPLPTAQGLSYAVAVNGFLYVFGGFVTGNLNTSYYAPIHADGTLGVWLTGPSNLPVATSLFNGNCVPSLGEWGVLANGAGALLLLPASPSGPDYAWSSTSFTPGGAYYAIAPTGDGQWIYYGLNPTAYAWVYVYLTPRVSVPLPAAGLTSGTTYHVLLQQQGGDLNDYLALTTDLDVFPGNPTLQTSARGAYSWTAASPAGTAVPLQVFDLTAPLRPGIPLHTWEDGGARIATYVTATTPDGRLLGICDAVTQPSAQNANTGFETGIAPWTVTGGTVAQSQAQVFSGAYSAQITPSGVDATVYLQSEMLPCMPGQKINAEARVWPTAAVTSNMSASINWYSLTGTYISTSSNNVSVAAATWTDLANTFTAPAGAYQYTVDVALSGTPAAAQVFYVDAAVGYPTTAGLQVSTVTQVDWPGTWPTPGLPTGTTQLA